MSPQESPVCGHRSVPHTADLCVEAWAVTREECIAEAVRGVLASFTETSAPTAAVRRECEVRADSDARLLAAVIEEVIYRMEANGELPVDVEVTTAGAGVRLRCEMVSTDVVGQIGAVPKAVSMHGLRLAQEADRWACNVTLDV
ncbi:archease [Streptomyces halobius]|uniref:Archease n=1 Tax=Streptomyces halobius TaxID=2879846 RepID=A0ABY4LZC6_9ACTN|nr:archease [Streptomyces halobius]UQA90846.1 archease [Streptomyces halobius]